MNDRNRSKKQSGGRSRSNGQSKGGSGRRGRKGRNRNRSKKVDPVKYWGDRDLLTIPDHFVTETPDSSTVISSLGRAPIPGQENASKHYFSLLYDRAAALSVALAAAGRISEMAELDAIGAAERDDLDGNRFDNEADQDEASQDRLDDDRDDDGENDDGGPSDTDDDSVSDGDSEGAVE